MTTRRGFLRGMLALAAAPAIVRAAGDTIRFRRWAPYTRT